MSALILIDFGSTYTKVAAVDPDAPAVLGTASSFTTAEQDVGIGLRRAMEALEARVGPLAGAPRYACSSAAGGLRMVACGLVPKLTVEAARVAALGAGAKLVGTHAYTMTPRDLRQIQALSPDILLLTGGMDGGNTENLLQNAQALARGKLGCPVVVAGNRVVADDCADILREAGCEALVVDNVMPDFGSLNVAPAQAAIRSVFLRRIVHAKGLSKEEALLSGILMPTPAAVMAALELLAKATGDLVAVDVGGATTDVYSMAEGMPARAGVVLAGLREPYAKRTVEGDLGMRYSVEGVLEAAGEQTILDQSGLSQSEGQALLDTIRSDPSVTPGAGDALAALDAALAAQAARIALERHAGALEKVYTPGGIVYQQTGKDLSEVRRMILTGGVMVHNPGAAAACAAALKAGRDPLKLLPESAETAVDKGYLLAAMGLLAQTRPEAAVALMRKEFELDGP